MDHAVAITEANFEEEVVRSSIPVLVEFGAEWCPPCRLIAPILDELSAAYDGRIKFGRLDTDEQPEITSRYGVLSVPTLLLFKDGELVKQRVGAAPKPVLEGIFRDYL